MVACVRVFTCCGLGGFLIGSVATAGEGEGDLVVLVWWPRVLLLRRRTAIDCDRLATRGGGSHLCWILRKDYICGKLRRAAF